MHHPHRCLYFAPKYLLRVMAKRLCEPHDALLLYIGPIAMRPWRLDNIDAVIHFKQAPLDPASASSQQHR